jgi:D-alanyl-D-alanine carboxypeptidase
MVAPMCCGSDGDAMPRVRIPFDGKLDEHFVIVYPSNGNRDGVWSSTLPKAIRRLVLPE